MKGYTVFNVEQIEGLPAQYHAQPATPPRGKLELFAGGKAFFAATGAVIRHTGDRAYYAPSADVIVPVPEAFRDAESYAATKAHVLTHWTAHTSRLDRTLSKRVGDTADLATIDGPARLGAYSGSS